MMLPDAQTLYQVVEQTWPPAETLALENVTLRRGCGGGKRVSAATVVGDLSPATLLAAEQAMRDMGQQPLFMIRAGQVALDAQLGAAGYDVIDPVTMYAIDAKKLTDARPPRTAAIAAWEPLQIMLEIWQAGGIGPGRIEVMKRAKGRKTGFISRWNDHPAGTSFIAMHNGIAMVHALEILPQQRRQGVAQWLMRRAAFWTLANGGHTLSVICTTANTGANALYSSLGMQVVGQYHYRILTDPKG